MTHGATALSRYPDWKAPAEDGRLLIWPEPAVLLEQTRQNHARLSEMRDVLVQNVPLAELRAGARAWIGHADSDSLLIATGHQTELYHPGVWVKNVLANVAAERLGSGAAAYHFTVDTDEPKHLLLRWPGGVEPITDDLSLVTAAWNGLVGAPTPAHLKQVQEKLEAAAGQWDFPPATEPFFDAMRRSSLEAPSLPQALSNSVHQLEWELGLRHHVMLASPIWTSEPFLTYVHHVLARADAFGSAYNAALADYRRSAGIDSDTRPMPDLAHDAVSFEVPFWLDRVSDGQRTRATVTRRGGGGNDGPWQLSADTGEAFVFDPARPGQEAATELGQWLRRHDLRLSPRAITLTTFLRLFVVDQFIHGIGGGRYDQVTDRLIRAHFGIEPPAFCVTTMTLYFPGAAGRQRTCVPCIVHEGHQLKHQLLGEEKRELVEAISAAPRYSRERAEIFQQMHRKLTAAAATDARMQKWRQRAANLDQQLRAERDLFDRELFFAIQPRERLEEVIGQYREAFSR